jgi:hypothetical protein
LRVPAGAVMANFLEGEKFVKSPFKLERGSRSRIEQRWNESNEYDGGDLNARAMMKLGDILGFEVVVCMVNFSFDVLQR